MSTHRHGGSLTHAGAESPHGHSIESVHHAHAVPCTSVNELGRWNADVTWSRLRRDLESFPDGLKVLELCGGMGTGHIALQELLKDVASFSIVDHFTSMKPYNHC